MSDAGLFELQAYVLSAQRRGLSPPGSRLPARARERDAQDEGAHGGLPAPRCTHQKDLIKEVSETFGGNEARRRRTFFFILDGDQVEQVASGVGVGASRHGHALRPTTPVRL